MRIVASENDPQVEALHLLSAATAYFFSRFLSFPAFEP